MTDRPKQKPRARKAHAAIKAVSYTAITTIDHDGMRYLPGQSIQLNERCASTLFDADAITIKQG